MTRRGSLLLVGAIVLGCTVQALYSPKPILVWNVTASVPIGLYHQAFGTAKLRDWVLIRAPEKARKLAADRHYLPLDVPMVKQIMGQRGDMVCRQGDVILINSKAVAVALERDTKGRLLPHWSGCIELGSQQVFVLTAPLYSFDSRYFGPVDRQNLIEKVEPLWTL